MIADAPRATPRLDPNCGKGLSHSGCRWTRNRWANTRRYGQAPEPRSKFRCHPGPPLDLIRGRAGMTMEFRSVFRRLPVTPCIRPAIPCSATSAAAQSLALIGVTSHASRRDKEPVGDRGNDSEKKATREECPDDERNDRMAFQVRAKCGPSAGRLPKSCNRMAAKGIRFPLPWDGGTIFPNLDVIWGRSTQSGHPENLGSGGQAAIRPRWPTITYTPLEKCTPWADTIVPVAESALLEEGTS